MRKTGFALVIPDRLIILLKKYIYILGGGESQLIVWYKWGYDKQCSTCKLSYEGW